MCVQYEVAFASAVARRGERLGCEPVGGAGVDAVGEGGMEERGGDVGAAGEEEFVAEEGQVDVWV